MNRTFWPLAILHILSIPVECLCRVSCPCERRPLVGRIKQVRKRDGRVVLFDDGKSAEAVFKAARAVGGEDRALADELGEVGRRRPISCTVRSARSSASVRASGGASSGATPPTSTSSSRARR
jgi:hypothetical protein